MRAPGAMAAALVAVSLLGCDGGETATAPAAAPAGKPVARKSAHGPVVATVEVAPATARVGDVLRLTLTVDAGAGVQVTMPPFGDALGRFEVVGYTPREEALGAGRRHVQEYRLQASRSGRLRIPPLRIEYAAAAAARTGANAGGAVPGAPAVEEILTEEVPVEIESVLTAEGSGALGAVRGELDEVVGRSWLIPALVAGGAALIALGLLALRSRRRRLRAEVRRSAAEIAFGRLAALEGRGLPEGRDAADGWYVELSDIVRRYIEDRFGIRAPELTTEEFLREARRLDVLNEPHGAVLSAFLESCDRVKFAGHEPAADESQAALGRARRLVEETAAAPASPNADQVAPVVFLNREGAKVAKGDPPAAGWRHG
jgi:hypothetical protein